MKGGFEVAVAGKHAPRDWSERGEQIPKEHVPEEVMAAFETHMKTFEAYMGPYQMGELVRNGSASMTFRQYKLGEKLDEYTMEYLIHHCNSGPQEGKPMLWIVSVEVRDDVIGTPVTRYPEIKD